MNNPQKEGGRPAFVPGPAPTFAVAFIVLAVGLLLLVQSGQLSLMDSNAFTRVCCILCTAVFFLRAVGDFKYVVISFAIAVWGAA